LIGVGLFLAFPLPKTGMISNIVAVIGGIIIVAYIVHSIRKKNRSKVLDENKGDAGCLAP
jgi:LPXTG-motif cell wall-anchored protein